MCEPAHVRENTDEGERYAVNFGYLALGLLLLVAAIVDQLWTALWVDGGAGPLSSRLTTGTWRGLKRLGGPRSRLLGLSGPLVLILTLVMWVGLLWVGWTFVFAGGGQDALRYTRGPRSVTWTGRIYFVAYTMFTMGNGISLPEWVSGRSLLRWPPRAGCCS